MKRLDILGCDKSADVCPFDGTEIWATSKILPRIDPISDVSKVFIVGNAYKKRGAINLAKSNNIPIVSREDYATEPFPTKAVIEKFKAIDFFTCELSYMIAYALYLDYDRIMLYGFGRPDEFEIYADLPRITYWLGIARGRNVDLGIVEGSKLWAIMQETVRMRYERDERRNKMKESVFIQEAMKHGDPYCFVTGLDLKAITVTSYADGKEISKWQG